MMELQQQGQSDRDFGCCHGQNEDEHYLPIRLSPSCASDDERQTGGIQHDFDGHEYKNQITAHQNPD